jgi:hypothetical protein
MLNDNEPKVRLIKIKTGNYSYRGCSIVRGEVSTHRGQGWYFLNPATYKTAYASTLKDAVAALDYASKEVR